MRGERPFMSSTPPFVHLPDMLRCIIAIVAPHYQDLAIGQNGGGVMHPRIVEIRRVEDPAGPGRLSPNEAPGQGQEEHYLRQAQRFG